MNRDGSLILPLHVLPEGILMPSTTLSLTVTDPDQIRMVDFAVRDEKIVGVLATDPDTGQGFKVGTAAGIMKLYRFPGDVVRLSLRGLYRFRVIEAVHGWPFTMARVEKLETVFPDDGDEIEAWRKAVELQLRRIMELTPGIPDELQMVTLLRDPEKLGFVAAGGLEAPVHEKQRLLEEDSIVQRLRILRDMMSHEIQILKLRDMIQSQVRSEMDKDQREYYLKEQMKVIQKELGDENENPEALELLKRLEETDLPDYAREAAEEEIRRLNRMHPGVPEASVTRNYLEWVLQLPWNNFTRDRLDLERAGRILDSDHFDLKDVKERVLEFLAVRKLNPSGKAPIICFVGPPGVGKTSMGRSIARALGRKFYRLSLGGMHDEAEIRGHRRTYIGAMPGRIIQGVRECGTSNPVFMLDEIDKLGRDFRGDPTSALLEVLDPEQNNTFRDNYLNIPFDLSRVKFITTANTLDTIPEPLLDRMEIIRIPGYTEDDKMQIARRYLVKRQIRESGLSGRTIRFTPEGIRTIIKRYTREAGVRELERNIGGICRKNAVRVAGGDTSLVVVTPDRIPRWLGQWKFLHEPALSKPQAGVCTGLAWTPHGGEILFIETLLAKGSGKLVLTGQLGDIMKESARAALSWINGTGRAPGRDFSQTDVHVHVPAGATPKDGPSAGVAMAASMLSAFTAVPLRSDTAVTGEITLRGRVLPVGGIKEKVLGALSSGIRRVVIPGDNARDLAEIPGEQLSQMEIITADTLEQAVDMLLYREESDA